MSSNGRPQGQVVPQNRQTQQGQGRNGSQQRQGHQIGPEGDGSASDTEAEMPLIEVPKLDPTGQTSQRTVEQKKKQEELVGRDKRAKGTAFADCPSEPR